VPLPAAGCGAGTADTKTGIAFLAPIVCNAADADGANEAVKQAASRYVVREALTVFALDVGNTALVGTTAAGAEARSSAPPAGGDDDGGANHGGANNDGGGDDGRGNDGSDRTRNAGSEPNSASGNVFASDDAADDGDGNGDGNGKGAAWSDGVDNDGDGATDFPKDSGCSSASDDSEGTGALAFTGANILTLLLAGLMALAVGLRLRAAALTPRG